MIADQRFGWLPEAALAILSLLPFFVVSRPIPDVTAEPFDNIWIGQFTLELAQTGNVFLVKDPYLRYGPQAIVLRLWDIVAPVTVQTAIWLNAQYVLLIEALVAPLLVYLIAREVGGRQEGILAVLGVIAVQFPQYPWVPKIPNRVITIGQTDANAWAYYALSPFGNAWFVEPHWQYAFMIPFALGAFYAIVKNPGDDHWMTGAGILLGIAGSIQVVQGLLTALIIAIPLAVRRQWRDLGIVAGVSMIVSSPNLVLMARYSDTWFGMGSQRLVLHGLGSALVSPIGVLLIVLTVVGVSSVFWSSRVLPVATHPLVESWVIVCAMAIVASIFLTAGWYRALVTTLFKYGFAVWFGLAAPATWKLLQANQRVGQSGLQE